jgi:polar amino acid transport system substrate-binding protein
LRPKTTSVRSNSSRTASRPASTTNDRRFAQIRAVRDQAGDPALDRHSGRRQHRQIRCRDHGRDHHQGTKQSLDFTSPIADATHYYVKRKDDKSISSIKDLNGKTVGVQAGSALLARLPELGAMLEKTGGKLGKVVEYTSYPEAYQDLALGRVDYVVNTVINLRRWSPKSPACSNSGRPSPVNRFRPGPLPRATPSCWRFLNGFIAKEKESGRFAELQKKWFGESFPSLPVKFDPEF